MVRQETWSYNTWFGKHSIIFVFQLYILRYDSTIVVNALLKHWN